MTTAITRLLILIFFLAYRKSYLFRLPQQTPQMIQPRDFETLSAFIDHLRAKPAILGILQYGNRDYRDMEPGGDFDFNVIVKDAFPAAINGLHFHINHIPVDCGIIEQAALYQDSPPSDYHCVLLKSEILYDPSGIIATRLAELKQIWTLAVPTLSIGEIAFERFIRQHIVDKFEHRMHEDEVYTRLFLSGNVFWLLEAYMKIEGLNPYDFKGALQYMKTNDPETYQRFEAFEMTHDLPQKMALTRELNTHTLRKIGGPWQKGEVIFHYAEGAESDSEAAKAYLLDLLFS